MTEFRAGQIFGRWTVIEWAGRTRHWDALWRCRCACAAERTVRESHLRAGATKSCGCLCREQAAARGRIHGHTARGRPPSKEWRAWNNAKRRCSNPRHISFNNYGARGITMAPEWIHDFAAFLAHIGPAPGPGRGWSVDRINNDAGYVPGNVRWATRLEQTRNRRPRRRAA